MLLTTTKQGVCLVAQIITVLEQRKSMGVDDLIRELVTNGQWDNSVHHLDKKYKVMNSMNKLSRSGIINVSISRVVTLC